MEAGIKPCRDRNDSRTRQACDNLLLSNITLRDGVYAEMLMFMHLPMLRGQLIWYM